MAINKYRVTARRYSTGDICHFDLFHSNMIDAIKYCHDMLGCMVYSISYIRQMKSDTNIGVSSDRDIIIDRGDMYVL